MITPDELYELCRAAQRSGAQQVKFGPDGDISEITLYPAPFEEQIEAAVADRTEGAAAAYRRST